MLFVCYPKCSTCASARKWLSERGVEFAERDIKSDPPVFEELITWHKRSGLPVKRFFNTSGMAYRALGLKEKLSAMTEEEQLRLLSTDGMLVKRPILVGEHGVLVGFRPEEWEKALSSEKGKNPPAPQEPV